MLKAERRFSGSEVDGLCVWPDDGAGGADDSLWSQFSSRGTTPPVVALSDSEEDEAERVENKVEDDKL